MTDATFYTAYDDMPRLVRLGRGRGPFRKYGSLGALWIAAAGVTALSAVPALAPGHLRLPSLATKAVSPLVAAAALPVPRRVTDDPLLLPSYVAGLPARFAESRPVSGRFVYTDAPTMAAVTEAPAPTLNRAVSLAAASEAAISGPQILAAADLDDSDDADLPLVPPSVTPLIGPVPLPMPRPADLAPTVSHTPPFRVARRATVLASVDPQPAPAVSPDNRSFLEKFFGAGQSDSSKKTTALGYAAPEDNLFSGLRGSIGNPSRAFGAGTAVYEIATHTVFMPDGRRLEAHSGLGPRLDNPQFVHERMRGPTPPATYSLTLRESLFHGVQALRLTPIGSTVFGRNGLLAHTYMLGPNGDSNGCVSFRDYKTFLQAFQNGDIKRLVVVARLS